MGPSARILPDGGRLHLQHGPIDLVIGADGDRARAFDAAVLRFETVLEELVAELALLRAASGVVTGAVARRMAAAARGFAGYGYLTPMISVAGAVADEVLGAMVAAAELDRAYVNNGGDIALHLSAGARFQTAMFGVDGADLGRVVIRADDPVRGIATSGRHGRSLSLGIADSVTVLARSAAGADAAATLIANAVDVAGHPEIEREPANVVDPDSDLGARPVVVDCGLLRSSEIDVALSAGQSRALDMQSRELIYGAGLFLRDHVKTTNTRLLETQTPERIYA